MYFRSADVPLGSHSVQAQERLPSQLCQWLALSYIPDFLLPFPAAAFPFFLRPPPQLSLKTSLRVWCQHPLLSPLLPMTFASVCDSELFLILHGDNSVSQRSLYYFNNTTCYS